MNSSKEAGAFRIYPTESEKFLGGHLHQSLQWNQHIRDDKGSLVSQLTMRINGLKKISVNATFTTRLMVADGAVIIKFHFNASQGLLPVINPQVVTVIYRKYTKT